jgi:hypothetical protein
VCYKCQPEDIAVNPGKADAASASVAAERKTCPVCGVDFSCMAAQENCWCAGVKLSAEAAAGLRRQFSGCLCPRCLTLAAERGHTQQL